MTRSGSSAWIRCALVAVSVAGSSGCDPEVDARGARATTSSVAPPSAASQSSAVSAVPRASSATPSSASPPAPVPAPSSSAAREAPPKLERRVFRQVLVGMLSRTATRLTWVLSSDGLQSDLDLYCQTTTTTGRGLRLTGAEQDDAIWGDAVRVSYFSPTPKPASAGKEIEYVFASRPHPAAMPCLTPPEGLVLTCRDESISVHAAGATLAGTAPGGPASKDASGGGARGVWTPATVETARARLCSWSAAPARGLYFKWSAAFVAPTSRSPGVEWAYENSDMVLQDGGYRWLPAVGF